MKKNKFNIILVVLILIGLSLLLYPTVSDYWNSLHQSRAIAAYTEAVANIDDDVYSDMWADAQNYNQTLIGDIHRFRMTDSQREIYNRLLDVSGSGIMGYIEIPAIECSLPIYHGLDDTVLQVGAGHMEGSSLPVGGEGSHCVISGHRGLPSAKLFTNLDQLTEGDTFVLRVLDETLTYEVDQILIVLPDEMEALEIAVGEDYCTLVTCTPYGVNSHRLLVRGHRTENAAEALSVRVTADALQIDPLLIAPLAAIPMLLILFIVLLIQAKKRNRRRG